MRRKMRRNGPGAESPLCAGSWEPTLGKGARGFVLDTKPAFRGNSRLKMCGYSTRSGPRRGVVQNHRNTKNKPPTHKRVFLTRKRQEKPTGADL